jgi:carbamate kinase
MTEGLSIVAFGGNALQRPGEAGTADEMRANLRVALAGLEPLLTSGAPLCITHGNGPQVGSALLRSDAAAPEVPPHPLDVAVATTQGEIGSLIATELRDLLLTHGIERDVATLVTHVIVDPEDPALLNPTKPIGPFYGFERAQLMKQDRGWTMIEDAGRGYRRVVGSPQPKGVLEIAAVRTLLDAGTIAVACGGGGIPVAKTDGVFVGVEAVIDKDRTAALLAELLGAESLIILTAVDHVYRNFGTNEQEAISTLNVAEALVLHNSGVLPAGSMAPKVEAAIRFAQDTGNRALITSDESLGPALAGTAGTWITP